MSEPWIFESGNLDYSNGIENVLLRNEIIDKYLSSDARDKYMYLVGPKGIGKTFLLNYKSYLFRNHYNESVKFSPPTELSENLSIFFTQFSKEEVLKFQSSDMWENIWKFALLSVACSSAGIDLNQTLDIEETNFSKVSTVLIFLLSDRKNLTKVLNQSMPKLLSLAGQLQSGVYIFLDGLDQAVERFIDQKFYDIETYDDTPLKVWTNIHVGIAKAIYEITKWNTHIKIYTTLRSEAFKLIPNGLGLNLEGFAIHLNYSNRELKEIFYKNIRLVEKKKLSDSETNNLIESFLGFSNMPHPFAKGFTEDPLDFVLRHTLGRPREIVYLGNRLFYEKVSKEGYREIEHGDKIEEIRYFINDKSEDIIGNYLKEIIPAFDEEYLIKFLKKIQSNIFHIDILTEEERNFLGICYNTGLIGIISHRTDGSGNKIQFQNFKDAGDYVYQNVNQFPKSDFYITHPILDCYLIKLYDLEFYNSKNVIGNNYKFISPEYLYDFAVSYSGKDRYIVDPIITGLKEKGHKIFYDKDYEKDFIGEELIDYLYDVYKKSAKEVIVFISDDYLKTKWTSLEFVAIKQRLIKDFNANFIKIVRIDGTPIPELMETKAYIDAANKKTSDIVALLG